MARNTSGGLAVVAGVLAVVAGSACSPPQSSGRDTRSESLTAAPVVDGVYCDGTNRPAVEVGGAEPNETIEFSSPLPIDLPPATADENGTYELPWSCDSSESHLTWEITATGIESGRSLQFTIAGSDRDPELDRILLYEPTTETVLCDGSSKVAGRITNAEPNELLDLTGSEGTDLSSMLADAGGRAEVRWSCSADQDGLRQTITATGRTSGRTVELTLVAEGPKPAEPGDIVVDLVEDPFVCDRGRRPLARLSNLTPNAAVAFEATPPVAGLRTGQAEPDGTLPVFWQCDRRDAELAIELAVTEVTPDRRGTVVNFTTVATESSVAVEIIEEPFVCDDTTRQFAVIRGLISGEYVDFESAQSEAIRQGRVGQDGLLPLRWHCTADEAGTVWEVTATGRTSGESVSFTVTGAAP